MEKIKYAFFFIFIGKAALISAMMFAPSTSAQMQSLEKDTFERSPKIEYVTEPNDRFADDVFVLNAEPVGNKERGEKFNKWFWQMVACANDDGSFNVDKMNGASLYFRFPEKDYKQLAADIICTYDKNGDNKVDYYEYAKKSEQLINEKAGKPLSADVIGQFHSDFFAPWFNGFDYDREKEEYNINEVAATLYALDCFSSSTSGGKGYLKGDNLLYELGYVMDNGKPDKCFQDSRIEYYNKYVIK